MNNVIVCNQLTKVYKDKTALDSIDLNLGENKLIGLIGRNGAGKTTFLKTCAGYLKPTSGSINILGGNPFDNLDVLSNVTFIDEEIQYDESLSLNDILTLGKAFYQNWDSVYADKLIRYFNLDGKKKYRKLSRGMKTQFNIIMGLSCRAPLTLMDEPTLGLDVAVRKEFYNILIKDYMENPRTLIISSHLMSELENLLEEMVLIHDGRIVFHKSIEDLQGYGLILNGKKEIIHPFIANKKVLKTETFGSSLIAGIENNLTKDDLNYLNENNVDISKASIEDVYIWLTNNRKAGGFDDFK
ncbi:ABC transporter ATP-binding protein [Pseudobacteroides cellulosolvens]|uniref:AAA ATPase n=1 Tax=Pseudobacteroides cellulosolvens ATCC 35603 = DSM 2933 TaxID=398512 RepID=A0A0L6JVD7_9FIRM|nr:ABC transporter ATP-binding protein [Pseudobacteroides cellulosolvens]KNY29816.1 AAA ATPase [Pseudobacteroides cellulosolvens ATCC 35603 = DSM 2933]